jgi:hypothetical protein
VSDLPARAVLLTQVALAEHLAAACALAKVRVVAVPTDIGALAALEEAEGDAPDRAAAAVSKVLANTMVVALVQRGGKMTATRWAGGERGEDVSALLLLDGAPALVEGLLLDQTRADQQNGAVGSAGLSRWRAARLLAGAARARR